MKPDQTNHPQRRWHQFWPWLMVLLVVVFVGAIRIRLLSMPLERDEGEYAYAGQLILQGIPPYELAYNMKFPGTYYLYALGMAFFGQTIAGVHLTLLVANAITIVLVFLLGRKLFGAVGGGVAAASFGVMSVSPAVFGMAAHANHFVLLFAVPATWLLWSAMETGRRRFLFAAGLLYGMAFLMKQQGIFFAVFGGLVLVGRSAAAGSVFAKSFYREASVFIAGTILPLAAFCVVCALGGDFRRFWFWTFTYAHWYATAVPLSEGWQHLCGHLRQSRDLSIGLWIFALAALPLGWWRCRPSILFAGLFWVCSFLATATGFYFRNHYFILLLPAMALLAGATVGLAPSFLNISKFPNVFKSLPLIAFALVLSWMIFYQARFFFQLSPPEVARSLYWMSPVEESVVAGEYLRQHSAPADRIAVIGSEPQIYFYANRKSATGYIYTYALMEEQPMAATMQREMIAEIESRAPLYLVYAPGLLSWLPNKNSSRDIFNWFDRYTKQDYEKEAVIGFDGHGTVTIAGEAGGTNAVREASLEVYRRR